MNYLDLFFLLFVPFVPGALFSLPALFFYRLRRLPQDFHWAKLSVVISLFLVSVVISGALFLWISVNIGYVFMMESTSSFDELKKYQDATVYEAWQESIIPAAYGKSCYSAQPVVCRLAPAYISEIWDLKIDFPHLSVAFYSFFSGLTSLLLAWRMLLHPVEKMDFR